MVLILLNCIQPVSAGSYDEIFLELEKKSCGEGQCAIRQPLTCMKPGKEQKYKMVCDEDLFSGEWKLVMHDAKGNPIMFANEGAEKGIAQISRLMHTTLQRVQSRTV